MRVAIATCVRLPEPDPDEARLLRALGAAGVEAELVAWDAMRSDLSTFDVCVIRSTWNYYRAYEDFLAWVDRASTATRLRNPAELVRWNSHKRYLLDLEVPVVPSVFVDRGAAVPTMGALFEALGSEEVVVKPAVSAGSFRTRRFGVGEAVAAASFLAELSASRDAMVQPVMRSVDTVGEQALVWIAGEVTHAVRKHPRFAGEDESVTLVPEVSPELRRLAAEAIGDRASELLYARVDVMIDAGGAWCVSELELIEPSLFFAQVPSALTRFVDAIVAG